MKRFHVHLNVERLDPSIRFYTMLFGAEPTVRKDDYAKWMLDDPRINFAISERGRAGGVDHLGFQVDDAGELASLGARLQAADAVTLAEQGTTCCYARSDKFWATDPQGVEWESFLTHGEATTYAGAEGGASAAACCGPSPERIAASCEANSCGSSPEPAAPACAAGGCGG